MSENQKPQQENPKGHARIPVKTIWLMEQINLPGGNSMNERIDCSPQSLAGRQYFVAHFVPAHQVIELEWYRDEKSEPYRTRIALAFVKRFD